MERFRKNTMLQKVACLIVAMSFLTNFALPGYVRAEINLPASNQFVNLSNTYSFPVLKGVKFDPSDPFKMKFFIDTVDQKSVSKDEASTLIKYFLAALTIPQDELWVNMSPYEKDRIITSALSETDLGKDMLSQDYILKQLSSSLTYPESDTGKDFWGKTYQEVLKVAKTTKLPVNTFNKIWIIPDQAEVYENGNAAFVTEASLKTMLEEDYLALKQGQSPAGTIPVLQQQINKASSEVMRTTILPKINADVNSGKNFATLRQIYHSIILAVWFKEKFKDSIYQHYIDKGKLKGIDLADKNAKEKIYNLYVEAFKKGIYNYIKPEKDLGTGRNIKRQYFSGGTDFGPNSLHVGKAGTPTGLTGIEPTQVSVAVNPEGTGAGSPLLEEATKTQRKPVLGYNLKGKVLKTDIDRILQGIAEDYKADPVEPGSVDVVILPPHLLVQYTREKIDALVEAELVPEGFIQLGVQDIRPQGLGEFTGYSPSIEEAVNLGATVALVAHSELSTDYLGDKRVVESDELLNDKVKAVIKDGRLRLILAVGEKPDAYQAGKAKEVIAEQLSVRLDSVSEEQMLRNDTIIAYEPVAAIGEKAVYEAKPSDAQAMTKHIREWLLSNKGFHAAANIAEQYGGSMKPANVGEISDQPDIDGGLVGGASLKSETAIPLYRTFAVKKAAQKQAGNVISAKPKEIKQGEEVSSPISAPVRVEEMKIQSNTTKEAVPVNVRQILAVEKKRLEELLGKGIDISHLRVIALGQVSVDAGVMLGIVDGNRFLREDILQEATTDELKLLLTLDPQNTGIDSIFKKFNAKAEILAYNADAQEAFSNAVIADGKPVQDALIGVISGAIGRAVEPLDVSAHIVLDSKNYPEGPVIKTKRDGTKEIVMVGETPSMHYARVSPQNSNYTVDAVDGLRSGVRLHHVRFVLPTQIMDKEYFIKKVSRDLTRNGKLAVGAYAGTNQAHTEYKNIGLADKKSIAIQNFETPDMKGSVVSVYLWYEVEETVKQYKSSVSEEVIKGLPISDDSSQQPSQYPAPTHTSPRAKRVAVFGARGRVGLDQIKQSLYYNDAHSEAPVEITLAMGTTPKDLIEGILNDSIHGRFLNFKRGDKITSGTDNRGKEFIQIVFNGKVHTIYVIGKVDMAGFSYDDFGGIDLVIDATDGKSREELAEHIRAGAKRVMNTAPGKAGEDNKVFPTVVLGVNDSTARFHNRDKNEQMYSGASCTTCSVTNLLDSVQDRGGMQGRLARERWNNLGVQAGFFTPEEVAEAHWQPITMDVHSDHAVTHSNPVLDKNKEGAGALNNALIKTSGLSKALKEIFPDIDPELINAVAVRILTNDMSVSGVATIIHDESGRGIDREGYLARLKKSSGYVHKQGTFGISDEIRDSNQGLGRSEPGILLTQSLRVKKLAGNTYMVNYLSQYDNEWGYSAGAWNLALAILEDPIISEAKNAKELLNNLDASVIAFNETEGRFQVAKGSEAFLKQPEGMLEYLVREAAQNSNKDVRRAAQDIINDISADLEIVSASKDEFDRQGLDMPTISMGGGYASGLSLLSARAIFKEAKKSGVVPVINIDRLPAKFSAAAGSLTPNEAVPAERKMKSREEIDPDYVEKIQAVALAAAVLEGYAGVVLLKENIKVSSKDFMPSEGDFGRADDALKLAMEEAKSRIKHAAEAGIYNFSVDLSELVNATMMEKVKAVIEELKDRSKMFKSGGVDDVELLSILLGLNKETIADTLMSDDAFTSKVKDLIDFIGFAYEDAYRAARDLTVHTRRVEQEIGHRSGPMALEFEFSYKDIGSVLGGLSLQKKLAADISLKDLAKPNRIGFEKSPANINGMLTTASKMMRDKSMAKKEHVLDFIGLYGTEFQAAALARDAQKIALGIIAQKVVQEPENERLQQLFFYMVDTGLAIALGHKEVSKKAEEKLAKIGMSNRRIGAGFRGVRISLEKIIKDGKEKGKSIQEIFTSILSEQGLPKLDKKELEQIQALNDWITHAFSEELWDLHKNEGSEVVKASMAKRIQDNAAVSNRAAVKDALEARQTRELNPDPYNTNRYRLAGYAAAASLVMALPKAPARRHSPALAAELESWIPSLGKADINPDRLKPFAANIRELLDGFSDILTVKLNDQGWVVGVDLKHGKDTLKNNKRVWDLMRETMNPDDAIAKTASWLVRAITHASGRKIAAATQHYIDLKEGKIKPAEHYVIPAENLRSGGLLQAISFYQTLKEMNAYGIAELAASEKGYSGLKENRHLMAVAELAAAFAGYDGPIIVQADHRQLAVDNVFALDETKVKAAGRNVALYKEQWKNMSLRQREDSGFVDLIKRQKAIDAYQAEVDDFLDVGGLHVDFDVSTLVDKVEMDKLHADTAQRAKENPKQGTRWITSLMREVRLRVKAGDKRSDIEGFLRLRGYDVSGIDQNLTTQNDLEGLIREYSTIINERHSRANPKGFAPLTNEIEIRRQRGETMEQISQWIDPYAGKELEKEWVDPERVERYRRIHEFTAHETVRRIIATQAKEIELKKAGLMDSDVIPLYGVEEKHTDDPAHLDKPTEVEGIIALVQMIQQGLKDANETFRAKYGVDLRIPQKVAWQTGASHGVAGREINTTIYLIAMKILGIPGVQHGLSKTTDEQFPALVQNRVVEGHLATQLQNEVIGSLAENPRMAALMWDMLIAFMYPEASSITPRLRAYFQLMGQSAEEFLAYAKSKHSSHKKFISPKKKGNTTIIPWDYYLEVLAQKQGLTPDTKDGKVRIVQKIMKDGPDVPAEIRSSLKDLMKFINAPLYWYMQAAPDDVKDRAMQATRQWRLKIFEYLNVRNSLDDFRKYMPANPAPLLRVPAALQNHFQKIDLPEDQKQVKSLLDSISSTFKIDVKKSLITLKADDPVQIDRALSRILSVRRKAANADVEAAIDWILRQIGNEIKNQAETVVDLPLEITELMAEELFTVAEPAPEFLKIALSASSGLVTNDPTRGGIDLGKMSVKAAQGSVVMDAAFDALARQLSASSGLSFEIIEMKALSPAGLNNVLGGTFMKAEGEASQENLQLAYVK